MPTPFKPAGHPTVSPYLVVEGLPKLLAFLEATFGARVVESSADDQGVVRHAAVAIGESRVMVGEAPGKAASSMLYVYVADAKATYARALAAGATSVMEPTQQFYGDLNAGVRDPSGNQWWIATHVEDVAKDELVRRAQAAYAARG